MSANIESMFYVREVPWHGLGINVEKSLGSREALGIAGLNWLVTQQPVLSESKKIIPGYKVNIRSTDDKPLGIVTDKYSVIQNYEAFAFMDELIGDSVTYETAGSLQDGKKIWLLAKLTEHYKILDDSVSPYMLFSNSHDGTGSIRVCMTPIRVVCQNTLNLALSNSDRIWSSVHRGNLKNKLEEAKNTLQRANSYMNNLAREAESLQKIRLTDKKVQKYIEELILLPENRTSLQKKNIEQLRNDLTLRYFDAPDLLHVPKNAWRFMNAVSDFATHSAPLRNTMNFNENRFAKTVFGNPVLDKAYNLVRAS